MIENGRNAKEINRFFVSNQLKRFLGTSVFDFWSATLVRDCHRPTSDDEKFVEGHLQLDRKAGAQKKGFAEKVVLLLLCEAGSRGNNQPIGRLESVFPKNGKGALFLGRCFEKRGYLEFQIDRGTVGKDRLLVLLGKNSFSGTGFKGIPGEVVVIFQYGSEFFFRKETIAYSSIFWSWWRQQKKERQNREREQKNVVSLQG